MFGKAYLAIFSNKIFNSNMSIFMFPKFVLAGHNEDVMNYYTKHNYGTNYFEQLKLNNAIAFRQTETVNRLLNTHHYEPDFIEHMCLMVKDNMRNKSLGSAFFWNNELKMTKIFFGLLIKIPIDRQHIFRE